jgi:hypothetical protein
VPSKIPTQGRSATVAAVLGGSLLGASWLGACAPAAPAPVDLPGALAGLLSDGSPADAPASGDGTAMDAPQPSDAASSDAVVDVSPESSLGPESYFCSVGPPGAPSKVSAKDSGADATVADATAGPRATTKRSSPFAAADAQSAFTAPLRLFSAVKYAGVEISVTNSILDLTAFPDVAGRCRRFATPLRSFHLAVGYSAAFYAQPDYLAECARVDASIDHDIADMTSSCPQVASIRLVKGPLDSGVEQPARQ